MHVLRVRCLMFGRVTTIDALFFFIARHQDGVAAVVFTIVVLAAFPLLRFRRPQRQVELSPPGG